MIYDVHSHLDLVKNLDKVIENAKKNNIKLIISNAVNLKNCDKVLSIAKKFDMVRVAFGLYPEEGKLEDVSKVKELIINNKNLVFAVGEIGMDFKHCKDAVMQEKIFRVQLKLAEELNLPAIIHTRQAEKEISEIIKEYNCVKVLHCFSGRLNLVDKMLKENKDIYFSIPANIVKSEHFQKMVEIIPKNKILTETDAPYLSPFKDKQNEPAFIVETIKKIAEIWKVKENEVEKIVEDNFERVFGKI